MFVAMFMYLLAQFVLSMRWLGADFDGVIVFDEAHAMANAGGGKGSRGPKKASQQGMAGLALQNRLPSARILYVSATGRNDAGEPRLCRAAWPLGRSGGALPHPRRLHGRRRERAASR